MKRDYFGTDGVRGVYGGPFINEAFAAQLGRAVARWLGGSGTVLIGRDTRASGVSLERAIASGLAQGGCAPYSLGVVPTPAVARAVFMKNAALGVVITASHNPAADNGIKFFGARGVKLTDEEELRIEREIPRSSAAVPGDEALPRLSGAAADYIAIAGGVLQPQALRGWRVVLDTANGATCETSPAVFRSLDAEIISLGDSPDGYNINADVGSEHPEQLAHLVCRTGAKLGVAHDGDGDRCVLCDERGLVLDGDEVLAILATHALVHGRLVKNTLVTTVQSNLGLDAAVNAAGGRVHRTSVGDRYVIEKMLAEGATLGGESSGHIICSEISPTGDGLVAALKIIEVMLATGKPLSELRQVMKKFPQMSGALRVAEKKPLARLPSLTAVIETLEAEFGSNGRVLVRYSGTEPKLRLLVEGPDERVVRDAMARLDAAARSELTVIEGS